MVTESEKSKHDMLRAMRKHIRENGITDFTDFQDWCDENNERGAEALHGVIGRSSWRRGKSQERKDGSMR